MNQIFRFARMSCLALIASAFMVGAANVVGAAPVAPPTNPQAPIVVPFRYMNNKVVVDARIDGQGPYAFAVDSGSETMIVTAAVAKACKLPTVSGNVEVSGTTGSFTPTAIARVAKFELGSAMVSDPVCTVAARPIAFDGYIGAPLFNAFVVQMDFGKHTLSLYARGTYVPDSADVTVPITFGPHRVPVVAGTIGGVAAKFEIDTGSAFNMELLPDFIKTNDLTTKFTKLGSTVTSSVNGPAAAADVYDLRTLALGAGNPINIDGAIQAVFLPSAPPAIFDGRIGAPMLSRLVVTFNYAQSKMYLRPIPPPEGISL